MKPETFFVHHAVDINGEGDIEYVVHTDNYLISGYGTTMTEAQIDFQFALNIYVKNEQYKAQKSDAAAIRAGYAEQYERRKNGLS